MSKLQNAIIDAWEHSNNQGREQIRKQLLEAIAVILSSPHEDVVAQSPPPPAPPWTWN